MNIKSKNKQIIKIVIVVLLFIVVFQPFIANATSVKIPTGSGGEVTDQNTLPGYIKALYNWALAIIGVSALVVIIIGGYQFMISAGNPEARKRAIGIITQALIGLVLAFSIYLILFTIDEDLIKFTIDVPASSMDPDYSNCVKVPKTSSCADGQERRVWQSCMDKYDEDYICCCDIPASGDSP